MSFRQRSKSLVQGEALSVGSSSLHASLPVNRYDVLNGRSDTGNRAKRTSMFGICTRGPYARILVLCVLVILTIVLLPSQRTRIAAILPKHASSLTQVSTVSNANGLKCTEPFDATKPLRQYALMIDAGSTGSRIHVYTFHNCGPAPELENEVFVQTKPGLSSYKGDAQKAAESLDVLLDVALKSVPSSAHSCTPVAVKATAGLRILGQEMSNEILKAVKARLETHFPFPLVQDQGVAIMDGKDEGVYAWITTNYLLGKIGGRDKNPSAAVFDLGGGSTQIVFEPTFHANDGIQEKLAPGDHRYELQFGGHTFELYQHSHLGYGLMEARKAIHKKVLEGYLVNSDGSMEVNDSILANPCISPGMSRVVEIEMDDGKVVHVNMTGPEEQAQTQCRFLAESILRKDAACNLAPCSFNGIHQPSLSKTFSNEDVYIFSYFYDRTAPLGMPSTFSLQELSETTAKVCGGRSHWESFSSVAGAIEELSDRPEHCLDLNFILALLHTGYEMPLERQVKIAKKIKGNELGWCLGASLPLLDQPNGSWHCKIQEM